MSKSTGQVSVGRRSLTIDLCRQTETVDVMCSMPADARWNCTDIRPDSRDGETSEEDPGTTSDT